MFGAFVATGPQVIWLDLEGNVIQHRGFSFGAGADDVTVLLAIGLMRGLMRRLTFIGAVLERYAIGALSGRRLSAGWVGAALAHD